MNWLRRLLNFFRPTPPAPVPSPPPVVPPDPITPGAARAGLLAEANRLRGLEGLRPFLYDARLEAVGQPQADDLASGRVSYAAAPHYRFLQRVEASGFPFASQVAEGVAPGVGLAALAELLSGGPGEAHYEAFYSPAYNRVGFGIGSGPRGGFLVVDYGTA